jgi:hypothetical protein
VDTVPIATQWPARDIPRETRRAGGRVPAVAAGLVEGRGDQRPYRPPPHPSAGRGPIPAGIVGTHPASAPGLAAAAVGNRLAPDGRSGRQQWRRDLCHTAV